MRHKLPVMVALAAAMVCAGCMRWTSSTAVKQHFMSVPVRFVPAPVPQVPDETPEAGGTHFVGDRSYQGVADVGLASATAESNANALHVALWGGPYEGNNVTYGVTPLAPGSYTFAFLDGEEGSSIQGWVDVHASGNDTLDVLNRWKQSIPDRKRRLAYELELNGGMDGSDPAVLKSFRNQLDALTRLERRLNEAITAEIRARRIKQGNLRDLLRSAEVLLMPGEAAFFHPTTKPAFTENDLATVRSGRPVTKIVLVADLNEIRWKLRRVNALYGDLMRCKEVFKEEVDRLERRKGLFLLTDHLHRHDRRFVENEIHLQSALGCLAGLEEDINDLRERKTALAFMAGLFAPEESFQALDEEEGNLRQELSVLEAERRRIESLMDEVDASSVRRVSLERTYQRVLAAIGKIDRLFAELGEARNTLAEMVESTEVLHRQGDTRLLAATYVGESVPNSIRSAVESESVMSVRLQKGRDVFVPAKTGVTSADRGTAPPLSAPFLANREGYRRSLNARAQAEAHEERPVRLTGMESTTERRPYGKAGNPARDTQGEADCPLLLRLLVPPCWFTGQSDRGHGGSSASGRGEAQLAASQETPQDYETTGSDQRGSKESNCPFLIRLLVPPCWFAE